MNNSIYQPLLEEEIVGFIGGSEVAARVFHPTTGWYAGMCTFATFTGTRYLLRISPLIRFKNRHAPDPQRTDGLFIADGYTVTSIDIAQPFSLKHTRKIILTDCSPLLLPIMANALDGKELAVLLSRRPPDMDQIQKMLSP